MPDKNGKVPIENFMYEKKPTRLFYPFGCRLVFTLLVSQITSSKERTRRMCFSGIPF